jgi:hypothetical protein
VAAQHADPALFALSTLPPLLRDAVAESVRRDAEQHLRDGRPIDTARVSMTAHLREVLEERGLVSQWRRHFCEARSLRIPTIVANEIGVQPSINA